MNIVHHCTTESSSDCQLCRLEPGIEMTRMVPVLMPTHMSSKISPRGILTIEIIVASWDQYMRVEICFMVSIRCCCSCDGFCEMIYARQCRNAKRPSGVRSMTLLSLSFHRTIKRRALHTSCPSSLSSRRIASSSNNNFLSLVGTSVFGQTESPGVFTFLDLRAAAPLLDTRLSYSRIITTTTHTLASHSSWSALLLLPPVWSASFPSPTQRCRSSLWKS